ncbi:MAG: DUF4386 domain-containing protein [Gemmatimonadales bacterium]
MRIIGWLLVVGAVGVVVPYTVLTVIFDYPDILRQDAGVILTRFHAGGARLIWVWWAFAILGLPLLGAYVLLGQRLETAWRWARLATTLGVISGIAQIIGLLRWTFVVPVLARTYVTTAEPAARAAVTATFQAVHQFGGVVLGEHIGQLLTIAWTVMMAAAFAQVRLLPRWVSLLGYVAAAIYLLAQAELFATVIPGFPVWDAAGLLGSTLWLVWLIVVGVGLLRVRVPDAPSPAASSVTPTR